MLNSNPRRPIGPTTTNDRPSPPSRRGLSPRSCDASIAATSPPAPGPRYRPRRPARREPDAGARSPAPAEPGRACSRTPWGAASASAPSMPSRSGRPAPSSASLESLALGSPPTPAGSARPAPRDGPAGSNRPAGTSSRCLDLEDEWHRILLEGVPQPSAARAHRLAPPGHPPLPGRLHARCRPTEPLHPAPPQILEALQGRWTRQRRGSIRATVARGLDGARSLGREGSPGRTHGMTATRRPSPSSPAGAPTPPDASGGRTSTTPAPRWSRARCARRWGPISISRTSWAATKPPRPGRRRCGEAGDDGGPAAGRPSPEHRPDPELHHAPSPRRSSVFDFASGDVILTSRADYASNQIMYLSLARRLGVEIVRAPDLPEGGVDPDAVRDLVRRRRPTLVAIPGSRPTPAWSRRCRAVGEICRAAEVPYLVDACQAVGQMPIDVAGHRLRLPGRHRAQVPPGPARHRLSLRVRPGARGRRASAAGGHARRHLDRPGCASS